MGKSGKAGGAGGGAASTSPVAAKTGGAFADRFNAAFNSAAGANRNFVSLADLREAMGVDRETFDKGLRELRFARQFTLETSESLNTTLTDRQRAAGIQEAGSRYIYVSRIN